jgi:prepilin-type N-terminal cleavage/methylation domain-containing protein
MRFRDRKGARGFTLPELLISMAILTILTLALLMLFRSSLTAYKSTKKAMDANEETHTAFRVLERDLVQGYAAKHYGDSANFFGCPYGMTMICTMDASAQYRSARVSYVVHSTAGGAVVDTLDGDVSTQAMIRYIEPGVSSLDEYPVDWPDYTDAAGPVEATRRNLWQPLREIYEYFGPDPNAGAGPDYTPVPEPEFEAMIRAKQHELWLAMLGGRQEQFGVLPQLWDDPAAPGTTYGSGSPKFASAWLGKYPEDYIIAEGIMQTAGGALPDVTQVQWFRYGYTPRDAQLIEDVGEVEMVRYWNAVDPDNLGLPGDPNFPFVNYYGSPLYPFPPSLVATNINFAFRAPHIGEHHYMRRLAHTFQVPVGYRRPTLE